MKVNYKDLTLSLNGVRHNEIVSHIVMILQRDETNEIIVDESLVKITFDSQEEAEAYIEAFIYSNYPEKKQAQDEKWINSFTTKLKAQGVNDLEVQVVDMVTSFLTGSSLEDVLVDVSTEQKPYFEKLVKVAVRSEWAESCISEGLLAYTENREPVYSDFPKFD